MDEIVKLKFEEIKKGSIVRIVNRDGNNYVMVLNSKEKHKFIEVKYLSNLHRFNNDDKEEDVDYEKAEFYALNSKEEEMVETIIKNQIIILDEKSLEQSRTIQRIGARIALIKSLETIKETK